MKQININLAYLQEIAGGDEVFVKEMLEMIASTTPLEVQNINTYYNDKEYFMMASTAHKIKAPIQMLGDEYAVELLLKIEQMAKNDVAKDELPALVETTIAHLNGIVSEVERMLAGMS
jgi:hypothetical protein